MNLFFLQYVNIKRLNNIGEVMKRLTEREKTILNLMKDGFENNKIAEMIYVSKHTVKAHISSIIKKLEAKNRTNAVYIAAKQEFSK